MTDIIHPLLRGHSGPFTASVRSAAPLPQETAATAEPTESFVTGAAPLAMAAPTAPPEQPSAILEHLGRIVGPHDTRLLAEATLRKPASDPATEFILAGQSPGDKAADPHTRRHFPGLALVATLFMAATAAGAAFTPTAAFAEEPATIAASADHGGASASQAQDLDRLARSYGLNPQVLHNVEARGDLAQVLKILPPQMRDVYKTINQQHKKFIVEKLHGSSGFLFVRVSHRDAFIKGEAAGHNTFDEMQKMLQESVRDGKIDQSMQNRLASAIETFRTLTPQQRSAIVQILEADTGIPNNG